MRWLMMRNVDHPISHQYSTTQDDWAAAAMTACQNRPGLEFRVYQQLARSGQTAGKISFMGSAEDGGYSLACMLLYHEQHKA